MSWYDSLAKPSWTPPSGFIGTVWTVLYPIIFVAYGYVLFRIVRGEIPWAVAVPIVINLAANFAFTPIQFGLQNLALASADLLIVLGTIVWSMVAIWPYSRWATLALVPYLAWVATASTLQLSITWMNR
jgi:tryptophan-rich sensory protein